MKKRVTRRDYCFAMGVRASKLSPEEAQRAWSSLARQLESLGEKDVPKFFDLLAAIRVATILAKKR